MTRGDSKFVNPKFVPTLPYLLHRCRVVLASTSRAKSLSNILVHSLKNLVVESPLNRSPLPIARPLWCIIETAIHARVPRVTEYNYKKSFTSAYDATIHARRMHNLNLLKARAEYPYPLAKSQGCSKTFGNTYLPGNPTPKLRPWQETASTPLAKSEGYSTKYSSARNAKLHANSTHRKIRHPCPLGESEGCSAISSTGSAWNHMESVHRKLQYPCPLATSLGCPKMYTSRHDTDKHADSIRHKIRHPCPMAEEAGCISTFATSLNAQVHVDGIHRQVR